MRRTATGSATHRVGLAEPAREHVDVGVPAVAEVGAPDRVDRVVGLAAAEAEAALRGGHDDACLEAERLVVVDAEAALDDDAGVAEAALFASSARCRTQTSLPRRMPQFSSKASLKVVGMLSRRAPPPASMCCQPASISSHPGADSAAGVETLGRYGVVDGSSSAARATEEATRTRSRANAGPGRRRMPDPSGIGRDRKRRVRRRAGAPRSSRSSSRRPLAAAFPAGLAATFFVAFFAGGFLVPRLCPEQLGQVDDIARRGHLVGLDRRDASVSPALTRCAASAWIAAVNLSS
jgi:hypothetical protein